AAAWGSWRPLAPYFVTQTKAKKAEASPTARPIQTQCIRCLLPSEGARATRRSGQRGRLGRPPVRNSRAKGGSSPSKRPCVFGEQHACACVRAPPKRIGRLSYGERATTKLRPRSSRTAAASPPSDRITRWSDAQAV